MLVFVLSKEERCKLRCRIFLNIRKFDIAFLFKTDFPENVFLIARHHVHKYFI